MYTLILPQTIKLSLSQEFLISQSSSDTLSILVVKAFLKLFSKEHFKQFEKLSNNSGNTRSFVNNKCNVHVQYRNKINSVNFFSVSQTS
uniref:Uncharacterized protein n=1 Tax=Rhizophagus irregularis (strain DAOM 181602 / DAOM 197198 / MUCL 43194) TaxID=747089 RepID=U9TA44_RHIID